LKNPALTLKDDGLGRGNITRGIHLKLPQMNSSVINGTFIVHEIEGVESKS
jgi:hypothetical protein